MNFNLFAYCINNPVNLSDPLGHWPSWGQIGAFLLGAAIVATAVATAVAAAPVLAAAVTVGYISGAVYAAGVIGCSAVAAVCGSSIIGEAITGENPVKDAIGEDNFNVITALSTAGCSQALSSLPVNNQPEKVPVIGKMSDLNNTKLGRNEFKVADLLPDMGSPKANWTQNSSVLRSFMDGRPIKDVSPYPMENAGFLGAERNLLMNHGYEYQNGFWIMP